jgi:hypothetical protein
LFHKTLKPLFIRNLVAAPIVAALLAVPLGALATGQEKEKAKEKEKKPSVQDLTRKEDGKVPDEKELEKSRKQQDKSAEVKMSQADVIAEVAILAYGGRKQLETVRAATQEEGTIRLATDQGDITGSYKVRSMRRDKSWLDLMRVDLDLTPPEAVRASGSDSVIRYVIGYNGASVWSAQNGQYVAPKAEAEAAFRAQLTHEYQTLLRYKEDGSKLEYVGPETLVGVPTHVVSLTATNGDQTKYWVSSKTYRIVRCEYSLQLAGGQPIKYSVAYYYTPLKVAQNTLVPTRRVMEQDGKFVQEITITNAIYSAKLDPEIFQHLQE